MTAWWTAVTLTLALVASQRTAPVPRAFLRDQPATVAAVKRVPVPASRAAKRLTDARADARRPTYRPDAAAPPQIDLPAPRAVAALLDASWSSTPRTARRAHVAESRAPPRAA